MKSKNKTIWMILMAAFIAVDMYMLFFNLGKGYLIQTDEAWHATNGYEMFKQGNWIINSYRYVVDYFNSKPPLPLIFMIISYKIFGVSLFSARFPSALGGLITLAIIVIFLLHDKKKYAAALFPPLFGACSLLFTFHMYRAAEMDSLYNLFFVIAMLSLYMMTDKPDFMYIYGLSFGLAFMCKGPHSALIFVLGLLYIPKCKDAFKSVKRVIFSVLLAAIVPLAWMAKRYAFDGTTLFQHLFMGEVVGRVSNGHQEFFKPIISILSSHIFMILVVVIVMAVVFTVIGAKKEGTDKAEVLARLKQILWDNYLFIIWSFVPVIFFAFTRSHITWYTYSSRIALCILTARLAEHIIVELGKETVPVQAIVGVVAVIMSLLFIVPTIRDNINPAGTGGHPVDQFTDDMKEFKEKYGDAYSGVNTYLIADWLINPEDTDHWEPEYVAPAEMFPDLMPVDGTVENFLTDPDSILIIDSDKWDEYSGLIAGHVVLYDNSYLVFSSDMY